MLVQEQVLQPNRSTRHRAMHPHHRPIHPWRSYLREVGNFHGDLRIPLLGVNTRAFAHGSASSVTSGVVRRRSTVPTMNPTSPTKRVPRNPGRLAHHRPAVRKIPLFAAEVAAPVEDGLERVLRRGVSIAQPVDAIRIAQLGNVLDANLRAIPANGDDDARMIVPGEHHRLRGHASGAGLGHKRRNGFFDRANPRGAGPVIRGGLVLCIARPRLNGVT